MSEEEREIYNWCNKRREDAVPDLAADLLLLIDEKERALENLITTWLNNGGPFVLPGHDIYGPYADACQIISKAIRRGEYLKVKVNK